MLANNISNFDTVGYKVKDLPVGEFFSALQQACRRRDSGYAGTTLEMRPTRNLRWDRMGRLQAEPVEIKENNILFHDRNNRFVEKQMAALSKNALLHNLTAELLKQKFNSLRTAISGKL